MNKHFLEPLSEADPEIFQYFQKEFTRQHDHLELIASENYTSRAVLQSMGSILTNKYAEGYPGKRYYGGCEHVDQIENLARERGAQLYSVGDFKPHVNVQSHSGAQANQAVFLATMKPGDTYVACSLNHGGHLTHGSPVNLSGKWFEAHHYGVNKETECIDLDEVRDLAKKSNPKVIIAGYSAYSRILDFAGFRSIADEVGALLMVDMAHFSGLVAAGVYPSPFPHAHIVTSTTHKTLRGPRSGMILSHPELAKKIDSAVFPGLQGGPLEHVIAGKAVMFKEAMTNEFKSYAQMVLDNSKKLSESLSERGYRIVSGKTENHMCLVDLQNKNISGKDAELALDVAGLNANRNTIPFDQKSPFVTSGMRLGTPAVTTRGMGLVEMEKIAHWIDESIKNQGNQDELLKVKNEVAAMCKDFPIYKESLG